MLYALNVHSDVCQLFLNNTGKPFQKMGGGSADSLGAKEKWEAGESSVFSF